MNSPNRASTSDKPERGGIPRWFATIVLGLVGLSIPGVLAIYMAVSGSGPRSVVENWFDKLIAIAYLPGSILALFFGHPLAHPDDPIHKWNAFLFYAGGLASWTLLGALIGFLIDHSRREK